MSAPRREAAIIVIASIQRGDIVLRMNADTPRQPRYSRLGQRAVRHEPVITRLMNEALERPGILSLAAGFTDNAVLPVDLIRASVQRLERTVPSRDFLQYGMNRGRLELRQQIGRLLASYPAETSLDLSPEQVLVTNGSQQALYMSAQLFCDPGDIVFVEAPTYFVFLELLRGLGLRPRSLPVRPDGRVDIEAVQALFSALDKTGEMERVKLIYLMGVYANPSARSWQEADKRALGRLLQSVPVSVPVIEDMAYRELYFESPWAARSLLSLPEWTGLPVLYAGTFTKPFATGLKVGFVAAHDGEWIDQLGRIKGHQDFGTSHFNQAIIEDVIRENLYESYLATVRPQYAEKMKILDAALREEGLDQLGWEWEVPVGGLLLWLRAPDDIDTAIDSPFSRACLDHEVIYVPGDLCFAEGHPRHYVRLSFGVLNPQDLREAARRFAAAARAVL